MKWREIDTLSGGQRKRLVLKSLLRSGTFTTLLLADGTVKESAVPVWE